MINTVINGDALEIMRKLPSGFFNAIITDPPYCSGGFTEAGKRSAKGQGLRSEVIRDGGWFEGDAMTSQGLAFLLREVAFEAIRLLDGGGSMLFFCDWRMVPLLAPAIESAGLRYQNMIVWDKPSAGLGRGFRAKHECILHFTAGTVDYYDKSTGNVIQAGRVNCRTRLHQTEKPQELLRRLVRVVCPEGGRVLDPFAGSGSIIPAAVAEGRNAVGIERDPSRCLTANSRASEKLT